MHLRSSSNAWPVVLLLVTGGMTDPVWAQAQSVNPGINRAYTDPVFEDWVARFESPGREVYDRRKDIVAALALKPGMAVADIGAGTGLFTRLFAPAVTPGGPVFAVDISPVFIQNILRRSREEGLRNVSGIVNTARDAKLPASSVDVAFLCDTYHHFEFPQLMLESIHRALRPSGRLAIIDFRKQEGKSSAWVMQHVRADKTAVIREVEAAGFRLIADTELLKENYFLMFERLPRP